MRNPLQRLSTKHALVFILASLNRVATVGPIIISSIDEFANPYEVAIGGEDMHLLGSEKHLAFLVSEGPHIISDKCFGGWYPMPQKYQKF